jgi:hypothetical protein
MLQRNYNFEKAIKIANVTVAFPEKYCLQSKSKCIMCCVMLYMTAEVASCSCTWEFLSIITGNVKVLSAYYVYAVCSHVRTWAVWVCSCNSFCCKFIQTAL